MMPVVLRFLEEATGELHMGKRTDLTMLLLHHTLYYNVLSLNFFTRENLGMGSISIIT
jgi:hypothetical protein